MSDEGGSDIEFEIRKNSFNAGNFSGLNAAEAKSQYEPARRRTPGKSSGLHGYSVACLERLKIVKK
jgi:hypothetical protein